MSFKEIYGLWITVIIAMLVSFSPSHAGERTMVDGYEIGTKIPGPHSYCNDRDLLVGVMGEVWATGGQSSIYANELAKGNCTSQGMYFEITAFESDPFNRFERNNRAIDCWVATMKAPNESIWYQAFCEYVKEG